MGDDEEYLESVRRDNQEAAEAREKRKKEKTYEK